MSGREFADLAAEVQLLLRARGETVAVAESLTGGLLGAALTTVSGSSLTFRGGVIAYATDLKSSLLGVEAGLLERDGAVQPEVALAMARGVRDRLAATYGMGVTGVAGPDQQDGRPPGTVHVALAGPRGDRVVSRLLAGDRTQVRAVTVGEALTLLREELGRPGGGNGKHHR